MEMLKIINAKIEFLLKKRQNTPKNDYWTLASINSALTELYKQKIIWLKATNKRRYEKWKNF